MSDLIVTTKEQLVEIVREAVREALDMAPKSKRSDVMTREQVAELLQVNPQVLIRRYVRQEGLPAHKLDSQWRFFRAEVLAWLKQREGRA